MRTAPRRHLRVEPEIFLNATRFTQMANLIRKFFIACSGANQAILARPGCAIERSKYASIGATIFATAVLASLSGGYALYKVFGSERLAFGFGLLWGCIIFNLDRYIVSTLRKANVTPDLSYRQRLRLRMTELLRAFPRLLLAVFISIVITKPLELKLFGREINKQIAKEQIEEEARIKQATQRAFPEIEIMETQNAQLRQRIKDKEQERNTLQQQYFGELDGWGGTERAGFGTVALKKKRALDLAESELRDLIRDYTPTIQRNDAQLAALQAEKNSRINDTTHASAQANEGLLRGLESLGTLTREHRVVNVASMFVMLLFILLETAPITAKVLSGRGPYDEVYDRLEYKARAREQKRIFIIKQETDAKKSIAQRLYAELLTTYVRLSRRTAESLETLASDEVHEAQMEIARHLVAQWKKAEMRKLGVQPAYHESVRAGSNGSAAYVAHEPQFAPASAGIPENEQPHHEQSHHEQPHQADLF